MAEEKTKKTVDAASLELIEKACTDLRGNCGDYSRP